MSDGAGQGGGPRRVNRALWDALWILDHLAGRGRVDRLLAGARARVAERIAADLTGDVGGLDEVDRRVALDPRTFQRDYVRPLRPVVLEGAARDWVATRRWTPRFFASRYGDAPITLIRAAPTDLDDFAGPGYRPDGGETTLSALVDDMERGRETYARFVPILNEDPTLERDLDRAWVDAMRPRGAVGTYYQLFMGGAGTTTSVHNAIGSNLFVQLYGEKTWWLYSPVYNAVFDPPLKRSPFFFSGIDPEHPDLERFPLFRGVRGYRVTLRAGDVLYNPPFFWHYVRNPTASIGVGVRFYDVPSILRASPAQALLTALATNPPAWVGRRLRFDFTKVFVRMR